MNRNSPKTIALLNIGNELLDGRTTNTNATQLAALLHEAGFEIVELRSVPDTIEAIGEALHELAVHRHVVVTGGLGPTSDDLTAVAAGIAFGDPCIFHRSAEQAIRAVLKKIGFPYSEAQKRQAYLPSTAKIFPNRWGIAPGFQMKIFECSFHFLPGVPRECIPMFEHYVLPEVRRMRSPHKILRTERWRCFGMREADIFSLVRAPLAAFEKKFGANIVFSSQVPFPGTDIKIEFWKGRAPRAPKKAEMDTLAKTITRKLSSVTYSRGQETLAESVLSLLRARKLSLATAESCTGGLVGKMLTDIPGSSDVYLGGVISYANAAKEKLLQVKPSTLARMGAVSKETALEMASGARDALRSHYAISLTGVSGPGGGSAQKPVGTIFVGLSGPLGSESKHQVFFNSHGDRLQNRLFASHLALDMLRKNILKNFKGNSNGTRNKRRTNK